MEQLKPCPFCGGEAVLRHENSEMGRTHRIYCLNEDCPIEPRTHWYWREEQAIEAWNRRVE